MKRYEVRELKSEVCWWVEIEETEELRVKPQKS